MPGVAPENLGFAVDFIQGQIAGLFLNRVVHIANLRVIAGGGQHGFPNQSGAGDMVRVPVSATTPAQLGVRHGIGVIQIANAGRPIQSYQGRQRLNQLLAVQCLLRTIQCLYGLAGYGFCTAQGSQASPAGAQPRVLQT